MVIIYELEVEILNSSGNPLPPEIGIAEKLFNSIGSRRGSITTNLISLTERKEGGITKRFTIQRMTGTLVKVKENKVEENKVEEKENIEQEPANELPEVKEPKPEKEYPEVSAPFYLSSELQEELESEKEKEENQDPK